MPRPYPRPAFAIIRIDHYLPKATDDLQRLMTINCVMFSKHLAEQEVARLNELDARQHGEGTSEYYVRYTRLIGDAPTSPTSAHELPVSAIVRIDHSMRKITDNLQTIMTAKCVLFSADVADQEAARLNELAAARKGAGVSEYYVTRTRLIGEVPETAQEPTPGTVTEGPW